MTTQQPGYRPGAESAWWWKVAEHLDAAQLATVNAVAHNVDDPTILLAFQDAVRQAQAILLEIFGAKGLLPQETPASSPDPTAPMGPMGPMGEGPLAGGDHPP